MGSRVRASRRDRDSVGRAVATFAISGLVAMLLVAVVGVLVLRQVGTTQAHREAENVAVLASRIVEQRLDDGIVRGASTSLLPLDELVNRGVLTDPIVRLRILDAGGAILYSSDAPELIGTTDPLDDDELRALQADGIATEQVDAAPPEDGSQDVGPLLQVSLPVSTPNGTELLLQTSLRFESVAASGRELWVAFLPVLAVALAVLAMVQIPLALRLARRVRESQDERERLLRRAIEASDVERRRIAGDLHEGVVQQLAGLSMSLSAKADEVASTDPAAAASLREGAAATRQGVRSLRSALMGIYPPNLQRAGLDAALSDLAAPLATEGVATDVQVQPDLSLPPEVESLLYRAAREAIRNVASHSRADHLSLRVRRDDGHAVLEIEDDGVGFAAERASDARADGHLGLTLLGDLAHDAGGTVDVSSSPGEGTRLRMEVPVS